MSAFDAPIGSYFERYQVKSDNPVEIVGHEFREEVSCDKYDVYAVFVKLPEMAHKPEHRILFPYDIENNKWMLDNCTAHPSVPTLFRHHCVDAAYRYLINII